MRIRTCRLVVAAATGFSGTVALDAGPSPNVQYETKKLTKKGHFNEYKRLPGHTKREHIESKRDHMQLGADELPEEFSWQNVNGRSLLTKNLNQHIPQYCGTYYKSRVSTGTSCLFPSGGRLNLIFVSDDYDVVDLDADLKKTQVHAGRTVRFRRFPTVSKSRARERAPTSICRSSTSSTAAEKSPGAATADPSPARTNGSTTTGIIEHEFLVD